MKKLQEILLIDDNPADNFIHKRAVTNANVCQTVIVKESGMEALEYLNSTSPPDIIFLDINMPGMTGWEFLEEYKKFDLEKQSKVVVVMLTTSLNPDDSGAASTEKVVTGFLNKPLTVEMVHSVVQEHYGEDYLP